MFRYHVNVITSKADPCPYLFAHNCPEDVPHINQEKAVDSKVLTKWATYHTMKIRQAAQVAR